MKYSRFKSILQSKKSKQYASLFSVNMLGIPLGMLTSIMMTRYLGPEQFGDFNFLNSIFTFAVIIINLGIFHAGNRCLVLCTDTTKNREYYGTLFIVGIIMALFMEAGVTFYALFDSNINEKGLLRTILYVMPFGLIYLANNFYETLLHADNRIYLLSIYRMLPKILCLAGIIIIYFLFDGEGTDKLLLTLYTYVLTHLLVIIYIAFKIKPIFKNIRSNLSTIFRHYKSFGFDIYVGSIISIGFAALTEILISYFSADNTDVGYFTLAMAFSSPLLMVPSTIATTNYKNFSVQKRIPSKIIKFTILISLISVMALYIVVPPFIKYLYGPGMMPVADINRYVSVGVMMYGMADFFNRYLGANGKGKILRNASFLIGFTTLIFNVWLIPVYGVMGAAYTKICSGLVYLIIMISSYNYVVRKNNNQT